MKERQTVPFVAGLILVPLGGIVASVAIIVAAALFRPRTETVYGLIDSIMFVSIFTFQYACLITAPISLVVLPLTYFILRRRAALAVGKIVLTGVISAIVETLLLIFGWSRSVSRLEFTSMFISGVIVLIGFVVGLAFAYLTRLLRPADWHYKPSPIPSGA
ncbi:MAG TPA: hypothetical protein VF913_11055 [Xanthobacteraceae bacterium]